MLEVSEKVTSWSSPDFDPRSLRRVVTLKYLRELEVSGELTPELACLLAEMVSDLRKASVEVRDSLTDLLDENIRAGIAGLCAFCDQPSLRLVLHHWYELPDKRRFEARACDRCNGVLHPDNVWIDAGIGCYDGTPGLPSSLRWIGELDHVLPSLSMQRRWLREIWTYRLGLDRDTPRYRKPFRAASFIVVAWKESLVSEYEHIRRLVTSYGQRRERWKISEGVSQS